MCQQGLDEREVRSVERESEAGDERENYYEPRDYDQGVGGALIVAAAIFSLHERPYEVPAGILATVFLLVYLARRHR